MAENEDRERPKKSWREIDAARDRSSHTARAGREERPKRGQPSTKSYKSALDRLFESGGIGKLMEEAGGAPAGGGEGAVVPDTRAKLMAKVRAAFGADEATAAVNAYLAKFERPPEDFEFLGAMLQHKDGGRVEEALRALALLVERGERPRRPRAIVAQLRTIEEVGDDAELKRVASELRRKLG